MRLSGPFLMLNDMRILVSFLTCFDVPEIYFMNNSKYSFSNIQGLLFSDTKYQAAGCSSSFSYSFPASTRDPKKDMAVS